MAEEIARVAGIFPDAGQMLANRNPSRDLTQRQFNRRWAIEIASRVVGGADVVDKAREILNFVEEPAADGN